MKKSIGRNSICHCGSGNKYKYCCLSEDEKKRIDFLNESAEQRYSISDDLLTELERVLNDDSPSKNSPEYNAMENWIEEYSNTISKDHPFQECLRNCVTHKEIIEIAKLNGFSDYLERAQILYDEWCASYHPLEHVAHEKIQYNFPRR